jgi:hypothetical protein
MKTKQFRSEFDNDVLVNIIGKDDFRYEVVKPIFEQFGFGFMVPTDYVVLIDGEQKLSKDVLKWIEAHEVAHFKLGHSEEKNENDEREADTLAYKLLIGNGYHKAAQLLKDKFIERHGIHFNG